MAKRRRTLRKTKSRWGPEYYVCTGACFALLFHAKKQVYTYADLGPPKAYTASGSGPIKDSWLLLSLWTTFLFGAFQVSTQQFF
nr:hypothetical protein Itr_chr02CG08170 [Ipomoea trifida]GMC62720.1 hypothetical protein Iba_chr02cCG6520 [Ipomoea batatas]